MTDRTLGAATVSSEGMAELGGGAGTGGGGGAGVVTAVGAIPPQGLGPVGGEEVASGAGGPPPGLAVAAPAAGVTGGVHHQDGDVNGL